MAQRAGSEGRSNDDVPGFTSRWTRATPCITPDGVIFTYSLPAGEYALIDLDQDMTSGRPEALEGMYAIATLR